jgi:2-dehydropantoate 2-reductase
MKIAVVGCGAVGSYYGAMLSRAGEAVHFLLRSDYEAVRRNGVSIRSPQGDFNARPRAAHTPEEIGVCDLVMIALKTTANSEFPKLLPPLVGPQTAVLTLQNGLGNEEALAKIFPPTQILGGLCFVCLNRIAPGVIQHLDHGLIMLGEFQRWPEPRTHDIASMFKHAGVVCKVSDNLARAHWEKLVWNIPFNGLGVASAAGYEAMAAAAGASVSSRQPCLTTNQLLDSDKWEVLVRELMHEVIAAANALGHAIEPALADKMVERTRTMGAYKASTILDFERGQLLEMESLFLEPLRQARGAGVPTPRLIALCEVLRQSNPT